MGVPCCCEPESSSAGAYDAIHDVSSVCFQSAHFTWESFPHVAACRGLKGWDSSVSNTDLRVLSLSCSPPLKSSLSSNPEPWERLCPFFFRIPSVKNSLKLLYGLMCHHDTSQTHKTSQPISPFRSD